MRRFFRPRLLLSIGVALLALLASGIVVLTTPWFRTWLRGVVVSQIAAVVEGEFDISAISGSLLRDVTIHGAVLRQDGRVVLQVETLSARYDPVQLLMGRLSFDELLLGHPVVYLARNDEGWNVTRLIRTRETGPAAAPREIAIRKLGIIDGDLTVEVDGEPAVHLTALNLESALLLTGDGLELEGIHGSFSDNRAGLPVTVQVGRVFVGGGVTAEDIRINGPGLTLAGGAGLTGEPSVTTLDLRLDLEGWRALPLAVYVPAAKMDLPPLTGNLTLEGPLDALQTNWALSSQAGTSDGALVVNAVAAEPHITGNIAVRDFNPQAFTDQPGLSGRLTAGLELDARIVTAEPLQSHVNFTIDSGPLELLGYQVQKLQGRGVLDNGTLQATTQVAAYGASTNATAVVGNLGSGGTPTVRASGRLSSLNLARLPASTNAPDLATDISARYDATLREGSWSVRLDADRSTVADVVIAEGTVITAESTGSSLRAAVVGDIANLSSSLLAMPGEKPSALSGHVDASVFLPDMTSPLSLDTAEGSLVAALADSVVYGTAVARADIDARLAAGMLQVNRLDVDSSGLTVTGEGVLAVGRNANGTSDLIYKVDVPDLGTLAAFGVEGLSGVAHVEGRAAGTAEQPSVNGTYALRQLAYNDTAEALALNGKYDVQVPELDWTRLSASLQTTGTFVKVAGQEIRQATVSATYDERGIELTAKVDQEGRSIEIDGGLVLFPDYREVHLRDFTLSGLGEPWRLTEGPVVIRYGADDVRMDGLTFTRGSERLEATGTVGLPGGTVESDLTVEMSGLQVGDLSMLATGASTITGVADAEVRLTGTIDAPLVSATLQVLDGNVADVPFSRINADVDWQDRVATIDARLEEVSGSALTALGTVPTSADAGPLDLRVASSTISLGLVQGLTTHVQAVTGTAALDVHVTGTLASPVVAGGVTVADGAFSVAATGVSYSDLVLDVRLEGAKARVERASLMDDAGNTLTMSGTGDVQARDGARAIDVRIQSQGIRVLNNALGEVELTIDARAQGNLQAPQVTGNITVDRGRLELDELLREFGGGGAPLPEQPQPEATLAAAGGAPAPGPATASEEPPVDAGELAVGSQTTAQSTVNLEITLPDNVVLRGDDIRPGGDGMGLGDMNMTVGGNVAIRKEAGVPLRIVGAVEVVRGFYEFQGRRFTVERGSTIRFRGTDSINPTLDVTAEREVSGITAQVNVRGTAQRPVLTLSSNPPLAEGDVLSLIIFNQPMSQLGRSEQVDLADRAGDLALGMIATTLADSIGQALDVDLFEIRAPSAGAAGEVSLGTQVSERLFVGFRQEFGANDASRLSFEYRLTEALRLLTSVGQGADRTTRTRDRETAGIDLIYRIRY